jgi:hypothetical protein
MAVEIASDAGGFQFPRTRSENLPSYSFGSSLLWPGVRLYKCAANSACATFSRREITSDIFCNSRALEIERRSEVLVFGGFADPMHRSRAYRSELDSNSSVRD